MSVPLDGPNSRADSVARAGAVADQQKARRHSRWSDAALMALLVACAALPYINTLLNGFVYDDVTQVTNNPYLQSVHHLKEIFSTTVWSYVGVEGVTNYYRPMMTLGYLICYQLFGPIAYEFHLMNVAIHTAVVLVLFTVTRRLFDDRAVAFVAALIFALHPIHSESVAWIAAITDLELTFFYLLTLWLFLEVGRPRGQESLAWPLLRHALLAGSFVLALLSKEQALTLPLLAMVYEHAYRDDRGETSWLRKLSRYGGLWLLGGAYLLFRVRFFGALAPASPTPKYTWYEAALSAVALIGRYAEKLLWPAHLSVFYVLHQSTTLFEPRVLVGLTVIIFLAVLFAALFNCGRRSPGGEAARALEAGDRGEEEVAGLAGRQAWLASFGIVWLLATLAPVLNIRWMSANAFAERYLYLPSVGFCWIVAWAWTALWRRAAAASLRAPQARASTPRLALSASLGIVVVLATVCIVTRNRDWRDEVALFTRTLATSPDAYQIRNNLGVAYWSRGDAASAEREWRESLKLAPTSVIILNNLGMVCAKQKRYREAVEFYQRAIRFKPDYTNPHLNLGAAYEEMGLRKQAESEAELAVRLSPLNVAARNRLGKLYLDDGRLSDAEQQFVASVRSEPNPVGFDGLGDIYLRRGAPDVAGRAFQAALRFNPFDSHAHFQLGAMAEAAGENERALEQFEAGLETDPANPEARAAVQKLKAQVRDVKLFKP